MDLKTFVKQQKDAERVVSALGGGYGLSLLEQMRHRLGLDELDPAEHIYIGCPIPSGPTDNTLVLACLSLALKVEELEGRLEALQYRVSSLEPETQEDQQ